MMPKIIFKNMLYERKSYMQRKHDQVQINSEKIIHY